MAEAKIWLAGIPTDAEVQLLLRKYGVPEEGKVITYGELEGLLDVSRSSNRFKSIVSRWRKILFRDHNTLLVAVNGEGYKVALPSERVLFGRRKFRSGMRMQVRALVVVAQTDKARLTAEEASQAEHIVRIIRASETAARAEARRAKGPELPAPVAEL